MPTDPQYERQLEAEIDRELKALPELRAPATLMPRVLDAIAARSAVPARRQLWQSWPVGLRMASLALFLALFAGLCLGLAQLEAAQPVAAFTQQCRSWLSGLGALVHGLLRLFDLLATALKNHHPGLFLGGGCMLLLAYLTCVALAACSLRLGLMRTRNEPL